MISWTFSINFFLWRISLNVCSCKSNVEEEEWRAKSVSKKGRELPNLNMQQSPPRSWSNFLRSRKKGIYPQNVPDHIKCLFEVSKLTFFMLICPEFRYVKSPETNELIVTKYFSVQKILIPKKKNCNSIQKQPFCPCSFDFVPKKKKLKKKFNPPNL